ncbi:hypothetical protein SteCoe_35443 [Stentor coeruleus]|uniref:Uncharacterized protein n=1 Tax=Stentor coeruleus TaxID=5963 RepID=A0A1R2AS91_9CILI|nr:hypothetical protein SteCoe_35443 [Stentor coeruleus]
MSKIPRLPGLVNRYIEIKWIGDDTSSYTVEFDTRIPSTLTQGKLITPFIGTFTGSTITDGFYSIPATSTIQLPANTCILVTDWNLNYNRFLSIDILQAELLSDFRGQRDCPVINIESNPSVNNTLRRFKFFKIQKELQDLDTSSDCSENSLLYLSSLAKLATDEQISDMIEEKSERPLDDVALITPAKVVPIGFGKSSKEKADNFARKRKVVDNMKEDVLKMIEPVNPKDTVAMIVKDKTKAPSNIEVSYDIGIDTFPQYALEYLKIKYNIV